MVISFDKFLANIKNNKQLIINTPVYGTVSILVLSGLLLLIFNLVQAFGLWLSIPWFVPTTANLSVGERLEQAMNNGNANSLAIILTLFVVVLITIMFIKFKKADIKEYLALKPFNGKMLLGCIVIFLIVDTIANMIGKQFDPHPMDYMKPLFESAHPLWFWMLALIVVAPVYEEIIFRGFLFTGLASSRLGIWGASVISSLLFAIIHYQYMSVEIVLTVIIAMILSFSRVVSGSLLVPMILHVIANTLATMDYYGWFG